MARLIIVYWRDIPAQIIAERGRGRRRESAKVELAERFSQAIDSAAMRGGARDTEAYLAEWRRSEPVECGEDLEAEARALADRLEGEYDNAWLRRLIAAGGHDRADGGASPDG